MNGTTPAAEDGLPNATDSFSAVNVGRISQVIVDQIRQLIRQGQLSADDRLPPSENSASASG